MHENLKKMTKLYAMLVCVLITSSTVLGNRPHYKTTTTTTAKSFSDLLSKFHQNDFKLTYERTELGRIDRKLVQMHVRTFKYNRTTPAFNGSAFFMTVGVGYKGEVIAQMYRFASNEYRLFPMRFQFNFCEALNSSTFGLNRLHDMGNFECPLLKEKWYNVTNFTPDPKKFPPLIPDGHYMLELQFLYQSQEFFTLNNYGIIDRPIPIRPRKN